MDTEVILLRFDDLSRDVQRSVDDDKLTVQALNILMVVATFIAGVQAQIISITVDLPSSALPRAANFFAFTGLMLEISGTFLGAIHSLFLHSKVKDSSDSLQTMVQRKADLKIILKFYVQKLKEEQQIEAQRKAEAQRLAEEDAHAKRKSKKRRKAKERRKAVDEEESEELKEENDEMESSGDESVIRWRGKKNKKISPEQSQRIPSTSFTTISKSTNIPPTTELSPTNYLPYTPYPNLLPYPSYLQPRSPMHMNNSSQIVNVTGGTGKNTTITVVNVAPMDQIAADEDEDDRRQRLQTLTDFIQDARQQGWYNESKGKVLRLIETILDEVWKRTPKYGPSSPPHSSLSIHVPMPITRGPTHSDLPQQDLHKGRFTMVIWMILTHGNIPLASMACGVVCLAVSTILLSATAKELGKETWIGSIGVLIVVMGLSLLPFSGLQEWAGGKRNRQHSGE